MQEDRDEVANISWLTACSTEGKSQWALMLCCLLWRHRLKGVNNQTCKSFLTTMARRICSCYLPCVPEGTDSSLVPANVTKHESCLVSKLSLPSHLLICSSSLALLLSRIPAIFLSISVFLSTSSARDASSWAIRSSGVASSSCRFCCRTPYQQEYFLEGQKMLPSQSHVELRMRWKRVACVEGACQHTCLASWYPFKSAP